MATRTDGALRSRGWGGATLLALSLSVAAAGASSAAQIRVDGIAAVVGAAAPGANADVVLQSDVELRARLSMLGHVADASELSPLPRSLLRATLAEIVGEILIAREARRVQAATPSAVDVERERARLLRAAGGQGRVEVLLVALSADRAELIAIARRRALVAAFLSANLEGVTEVSDAALDAALAEDPEQLQGLTREQARVELRARMSRDALDRTIARWVAVLRARTEVHVYAPD